MCTSVTPHHAFGACVSHAASHATHTQCALLSKLIVSDAMGFIGFSVGSKFLLSELRGSLRHTIGVLLGQLLLIYPLVFGGIYFLAPWLEVCASP